MRDSAKVTIGLGSIWGLYALGALAFASFSMGENDSAAEKLALVLYGGTILPACLAGIRWPRSAAYWLMSLSGLCVAGFALQALLRSVAAAGSIGSDVLLAAVPALLGYCLLRTR